MLGYGDALAVFFTANSHARELVSLYFFHVHTLRVNYPGLSCCAYLSDICWECKA
jgi:hypothetical protein